MISGVEIALAVCGLFLVSIILTLGILSMWALCAELLSWLRTKPPLQDGDEDQPASSDTQNESS